MKVVVLAGGISTERDVSLISGKMIYQAMKRLGHQAVLLDVFLGMERDDIDHIFESDEDFSAGIEAIHEINPDISAVKALRKDGGKCYFGPNVIRICQMADVVFLGLHGADGEGGKVQAAFDLLGIRYTGTDFVSGALAMDKCLAKELFLQNGIPTPAGFRLKKGQEPEEGRQPKFPCVVKVSSGGSSIGVSIVQKEEDYQAALDDAFLYGDEVVVEEYIKFLQGHQGGSGLRQRCQLEHCQERVRCAGRRHLCHQQPAQRPEHQPERRLHPHRGPAEVCGGKGSGCGFCL